VNLQEYMQLDGIGLASLVQAKDVSPTELLTCALQRLEQVNPSLNAVIHTFAEKAMSAANQLPSSQPFSGVPFLLKDLQCALAGEPMSMGSRGIRWTPETDSTLASRYRSSGLNIFGKTNTPEYGLIITTEPKAFGPTHNPHRQGYSAGGSSGGSAAAVVSGIVPMAHGGDGGGSIRFPAAWCGAFGLKPSRNRTPMGPKIGEDWAGAVVEHAITRSVRDSAALLDATLGEDVASPFSIPKPAKPYVEMLKDSTIKPMKIIASAQPHIRTQVDPEVSQAVIDTATKLENLGHTVEWRDPEFNHDDLWSSFFIVVAAHVAAVQKEIKQTFGRKAARLLEPQTKNLAMIGRSFSAGDLVMALNQWQNIRAHTHGYMLGYDAYLCPTVPTTAVKHRALLKSPAEEWLLEMSSHFNMGKLSFRLGLAEQFAMPVLEKMAFTILGNITGLPAASLPLAKHSNGLPIGVQMYGQFAEEETLFQLAKQLEPDFIGCKL